jgi:two-component system chemotaxis sensor kinase CheA
MSNQVLIVDDEQMLLSLVTHFLNGRGIPVITASGGPEALDILGERYQEIGLILLDIAMPSMNGYEVARAIRKELNITELPILALTALAGVETEQLVLEAGMDAMIAKPFDGPELLKVLAKYGLYQSEE